MKLAGIWLPRRISWRRQTALDVSMSYICKVENDWLHFGDYPSEKCSHKPAAIRKRIRQRPDLFQYEITPFRVKYKVTGIVGREGHQPSRPGLAEYLVEQRACDWITASF